jgi:hypothetical protein
MRNHNFFTAIGLGAAVAFFAAYLALSYLDHSLMAYFAPRDEAARAP